MRYKIVRLLVTSILGMLAGFAAGAIADGATHNAYNAAAACFVVSASYLVLGGLAAFKRSSETPSVYGLPGIIGFAIFVMGAVQADEMQLFSGALSRAPIWASLLFAVIAGALSILFDWGLRPVGTYYKWATYRKFTFAPSQADN